MLAKRIKASRALEDATEAFEKLGGLPKDLAEGAEATRLQALGPKRLWARLNAIGNELKGCGNVNKKALDQYADFVEKRAKLREGRNEVDLAESAIQKLITYLDGRKENALRDLFTTVADHFAQVFSELVAGGSGRLVMQYAPAGSGGDGPSASAGGPSGDREPVGEPVGVGIHVKFATQGDTQTMNQLSGGQKTMVALCLVFAIQRIDSAPFYIFDEIDAALDATHRAGLAAMIERQSATRDAQGRARTPTQFITTTFRPELVSAGQRFYGVTHLNKTSTVKPIQMGEAQRVIAEDQSRARQHARPK